MMSLKQQKTLKRYISSRLWGVLFIIAAPLALGFNTGGAQVVPVINNALNCGRLGEVSDVAPGNALFRVNVNLNNFPNAICNDGSGAVFYVRRASNYTDRNKWHIHLQGGGGCQDGQSCGQRWCSADTNFGADRMSTTFSTLPNGIQGWGIFNRNPQLNNFAGWNHVLLYYCSSDMWSGTVSNVQLSVTGPGGATSQYRIHFQGANIVDAVIKTLQQIPGGPVTYQDEEHVTCAMPDLDEATHVLFSGTSAGSSGVRHHADRVGQALRRDNVQCQTPGICPLDYRAVIDAGYGPSFENRDYTNYTGCLNFPFFCDYASLMQDQWNNVTRGLYNGRVDQSCVAWHKANQPGTEWKCADTDHVMENHITTPYFTRIDLQDSLKLGNYVTDVFGSADDFGQAVYSSLLSLPNLDTFAEEGSVLSGGPQMATPGIFGPQCTQHVGLTSNQAFFNVRVLNGLLLYNAHDVLWNWWTGQRPQRVVYPYAGPGPAANCP